MKRCLACGREFAPAGKRVCCSPECAAARRRAANAARTRERYQRLREDPAWLAQHLAGVNRRRRVARGLPPEGEIRRPCAVCGREYAVARGPEKFCSDACRDEHRRSKKARARRGQWQAVQADPARLARQRERSRLSQRRRRAAAREAAEKKPEKS